MIVGGVRSGTDIGNAAIWTAQGVQILPNPANRPKCTLGALSDTGDFACGSSVDYGTGTHAVVWLRSGGMMDAQAFLTSRGVTWFGSWIFRSLSGVTPDGRTIVGSGQHLVNAAWSDEAFIIHLCSTSDYNHDGSPGTDADVEDFFSCLGGQCCPTCYGVDVNNDGDVGTDADIESFFRILAGQPC